MLTLQTALNKRLGRNLLLILEILITFSSLATNYFPEKVTLIELFL